jgi:2-methylcitrate dehydratase PrpD/SAM-dependent methyltransferase
MVNAAASHFAEQDDVHNGSVFHPGAVVFPPALAVAQALGASGRELLTAAVAGYEVGIRVGGFLGRSHYKVFHTTGTAGTLAAAAAAGRLLGLDPAAMLHAFGSAGTQAAGLWEFLRDAADSKQLHTAKAAADGLLAAYLAQDGFTGAKRILEGAQGMAAGMSTDADPAKLTDRLGQRWALAETSFKYHASCRHTHPAADALLQVMTQHRLAPEAIRGVTAHVHQAAIDVLGAVTDPTTVHQAKFSMGTVLGAIAVFQRAGLAEFERHFRDPAVIAVRDRVRMVHDPEVEAEYPRRWIGKVTVETTDGRTLTGRVDEPKGDPGNTLSRAELAEKAQRLAEFSGAATAEEVRRLCVASFAIAATPRVEALLPAAEPRAMSAADFDARAATWDDDPAKVERAQAVADAIVRHVPLAASMRALEYGAGTGLVSFMLRDRLGEVTLADLSDGMIAVAAAKIAAAGDGAMRAAKLDLLADPLPQPPPDIIYSAMTLHHIPDTDAILRRFGDALAKDGYLCIADLDREDGSFHGPEVDVHHGFDRAALGAKARAAGFASVEFSTAHVMTKDVGGTPTPFPIFLMVARKEPTR